MSRRRQLELLGLVGLVLVAGALLWSGQSGPKSCTEMGCTSQVEIDLRSLPAEVIDRTASVELCVNGRCSTRSHPSDRTTAKTEWRGPLGADLAERTDHGVTLRMLDSTGAEVQLYELSGETQAEEYFPNVPDCPPPCWYLALAVDGDSLHPESRDALLARSGTTR